MIGWFGIAIDPKARSHGPVPRSEGRKDRRLACLLFLSGSAPSSITARSLRSRHQNQKQLCERRYWAWLGRAVLGPHPRRRSIRTSSRSSKQVSGVPPSRRDRADGLQDDDQSRPWAKAMKAARAEQENAAMVRRPALREVRERPVAVQREIDTLAAWADGGAPRGRREAPARGTG